MLIEFRVKNYCCLRDEQVLSFVPTDDKTLEECNVYETGVPSVPRLLRTAAIFGPNAGGKSTVLRAFQSMMRMINFSATSTKRSAISLIPFKLDNTSAEAPTSFEVSFLHDGRRYQYGFSCTPERIYEEYFFEYVTSRPKMLFQRTYDTSEKKEKYLFGNALRGQKNLWRESTQENVLFLSRAAQLNSEQVSPIFKKISFNAYVFNSLHKLRATRFYEELKKGSILHTKIKSFLAAADIGIKDFILEKEFSTTESELFNIENYKLSFVHNSGNEDVNFSWKMESSGTIQLFEHLPPLLKALEHGSIIAVDELDSSLHPLLVRRIVDMFQSPENNPHGAQLIFTTHDATLLQSDPPLLRRDQIWFVEKQKDQASDLYSLAEFKGQKGADFLRSYLRGLYGGIPLLREWRNEA